MKAKNKLIRDISIRYRSNKIESKRRSLKVLIRLKLINYLNVLHNLSKLHKKPIFGNEKNRCFITSRSSGNLSKVSLSRIKLRELSYNGLLQGFNKASW